MSIERRLDAPSLLPDGVRARGTALATTGLAAVLILLSAICTWVALDANRSSARASYQLRVASAGEAVLEAALAEQAAQLHYLECPLSFDADICTAQERRTYEEARRQLGVALHQVETTGDRSDRIGAAYVRLLEGRYDLTVQRQFAAIENGRDQEAKRLQRDVTGPEIEQVLQLVHGAAETHQARAAAGIGHLGWRTRRSAELIPGVFGVAFLLLGGCWAVLFSLQRRLHRQAGALSRGKLLVDGVISAIPHLVYWKDAEGRYQGMNTAFAEQLTPGTASDELQVVLTDLELEVVRTGSAVMNHQAKAEAPDGAARRLLVSVIPRPGTDRAMEGVIGVGTDVTQIRALEQQLAQAHRLEAIGQLAAGIAHEINTPIQFITFNTQFVARSIEETLTTLRELVEILQQGTPDPVSLRSAMSSLDLAFLEEELPGALAESLAGLHRVAEIVRAMKEFSHPGDGRRQTDLNAVIDSTIKVSRGEWKDVAEVDLELDPDLGTISCYEGELKQVLLNLVVNAAQAIAEGRAGCSGPLGRIRISTSRSGDQVQITVADDGPGMTEDVRQRVFDPFFTTKDVGKGTGQGLALAHTTIVRKHGGTIDVRSTPGQGTTFVITLPVEPGTVEAAETSAAGSPLVYR
ncbi:MAG TPA: ATP-binding protein [Kineosporiaceae bacterium]|nr:ATP-binding protein [Kineosporiaceae bacterium]